MKVYEAASIRNVALVGHTGSGKTQLTAAILSTAGMVNRFGKVDEGTTVTDFDEEEIARKHTLSASLAYVEWNKHKVNVIDTPGIGNFLSDARAALTVADAALIVVDAVSGVMVQTEKVWAAAEELELPRMIVLNRLDRDRASLDRSLQSLREACGRAVIPIQLPLGEEKAFRGVVDLVTRKAYTYQTDESGKFSEGTVPAERSGGRRGRARSADRDGGGGGREADGEVLRGRDPDRRRARGRPAQRDGRRARCSRWSARRGCSTSGPAAPRRHRRLRAVARRSTVQGRRTRAAFRIARKADDKGPAAAFVWKTVADPFAGRITMFRVVSGALKSDSTVHNKTKDVPERLGHLQLQQGKTPSTVPEIKAGDLGAVAKLKDTLTNDTIGDRAMRRRSRR